MLLEAEKRDAAIDAPLGLSFEAIRRDGRAALARILGIVPPLFPIPRSPPPHPFRRFDEAAPIRRAIRTQGTSLPGPERKSDKAPAIITDGAKKWRRGTDG